MWELERAETELWKAPPEPVFRMWLCGSCGQPDRLMSRTATELVQALQMDIKPNTPSTMRLNVNAGRLLNEYNIQYEEQPQPHRAAGQSALIPKEA